MEWHDCEVSNGGAPQISVRGSVAKVADGQGVTNWHVSLSHDGPVAIAYVIAEKV
jgi:holo-[acyl-carrier protein] synthase